MLSARSSDTTRSLSISAWRSRSHFSWRARISCSWEERSMPTLLQRCYLWYNVAVAAFEHWMRCAREEMLQRWSVEALALGHAKSA